MSDRPPESDKLHSGSNGTGTIARISLQRFGELGLALALGWQYLDHRLAAIDASQERTHVLLESLAAEIRDHERSDSSHPLTAERVRELKRQIEQLRNGLNSTGPG